VVTACEVDNRKRVTPPENSPNGQEILVDGTGELVARRLRQPMALTAAHWLPTDAVTTYEGLFREVDTCPPE
jgi:hypothetical protein